MSQILLCSSCKFIDCICTFDYHSRLFGDEDCQKGNNHQHATAEKIENEKVINNKEKCIDESKEENNKEVDGSVKKKGKGRPLGKTDQHSRVRAAFMDLTTCKLELLKILVHTRNYQDGWHIDNEVLNYFIFFSFM